MVMVVRPQLVWAVWALFRTTRTRCVIKTNVSIYLNCRQKKMCSFARPLLRSFVHSFKLVRRTEASERKTGYFTIHISHSICGYNYDGRLSYMDAILITLNMQIAALQKGNWMNRTVPKKNRFENTKLEPSTTTFAGADAAVAKLIERDIFNAATAAPIARVNKVMNRRICFFDSDGQAMDADSFDQPIDSSHIWNLFPDFLRRKGNFTENCVKSIDSGKNGEIPTFFAAKTDLTTFDSDQKSKPCIQVAIHGDSNFTLN